MKIAILTTDTPHHAYFVKALNDCFGNVFAFCETEPRCKFPFKTSHSFEGDRNVYEWERWFEGREVSISELVPTKEFSSLKDDGASEALRQSKPDAVIVFGTGILGTTIIEASPPRKIFNLHGGDPEYYRGLDTHLWAIYHRDFVGLITTLHHLNAGLDTGDIVLQSNIPISPGMPLYTLRAKNTEVCVRLAATTIDMINRYGAVTAKQQYQRGRYYSAMPADLKAVCLRNFDAYVRQLSHVE